MQTISIIAGARIEDAAALLVARAPACAKFSGLRIRARYATTKPADVVAKFFRDIETRSIVWAASPEGKRRAAETAERTAKMQATMDRLVGVLPVLPMDSCHAVLAWVGEASDAADRIGVSWDRDAVTARFVAAGWGVGVNCGEDFDAADARNFAGWIVGQWLASRWPGVAMFVDQWREKFGPTAEQQARADAADVPVGVIMSEDARN